MTSLPIKEEARALARLAAPVVVTQIGLIFMQTVDTLLVGPLGKFALSGVGLGGSLAFLLIVFGFGVLTVIDTLVAQRFGADQRGRCGDALWQGLWIAATISVPITAWLLHFEPVLRLLRQDPQVVLEAGRYLDGLAWSVAPMMLFTAQRGFLNGVGRTKPFMVIALVANVVNAVAAWALIYGRLGAPQLGVLGAGWATALSRTFMFVATSLVIWGRGRYAAYGVGARGPDRGEIVRMLRIGVPTGLTFAAEVGIFLLALVMIGWLGPAPQAAHHIAINLASLTFMVPLGVSVAASVRVGHAVGRRAWESARVAAGVAYVLGVGFMAVAGVTLAIFAVPLARLFTDDVEVIAIAATLIRIAALFQVSDGAQTIGAGCLRGAADTRAALVANILGHWAVGLPLGSVLAFRYGLGARGIWYGLTASLTFVAVFLAIRFYSGKWKARAVQV